MIAAFEQNLIKFLSLWNTYWRECKMSTTVWAGEGELEKHLLKEVLTDILEDSD